MITAPISPTTVTVLGHHWPATHPWAGFDFTRAELRSGSIWAGEDYHLGVPWMRPDDIARIGRNRDSEGIYRLRLKRGWRSFVCVDGVWLVSKAAPVPGVYGTPASGQISTVVTMRKDSLRVPGRDRNRG